MHSESSLPQIGVWLLLWCGVENEEIDGVGLCHFVADDSARMPVMLFIMMLSEGARDVLNPIRHQSHL